VQRAKKTSDAPIALNVSNDRLSIVLGSIASLNIPFEDAAPPASTRMTVARPGAETATSSSQLPEILSTNTAVPNTADAQARNESSIRTLSVVVRCTLCMGSGKPPKATTSRFSEMKIPHPIKSPTNSLTALINFSEIVVSV